MTVMINQDNIIHQIGEELINLLVNQEIMMII